MEYREDHRKSYCLQNNDELHCGEVIYQIEKVLGFGGSAVLYKCKIKDNETSFVLKECYPARGQYKRVEGLIQAADSSDVESLARLKRYMEIFKQEQHLGQTISNTTRRVEAGFLDLKPTKIKTGEKIYTIENDDDQSGTARFTLLRNLMGQAEPLSMVISNKQLEITAIVDIIEKILVALADLQESKMDGYGFIHGDVSLNNIWIERHYNGEYGEAVFIDFGSTRKLNNDGETDELCAEEILSTGRYRAPEIQGNGIIKLSKSADIYSVGVILLQMLVPFDEAVVTKLATGMHKLLDSEAQKIKCPRVVLDKLNEILKRSLAESREARYQSATEMLEDIKKLQKYIQPPAFLLPAIPTQSTDYIKDSRKNDVENICNALKAEDNPIFISGVGGIGKSSIAIEVANTMKSYFNGAYWITFKPSEKEGLESMENTILNAYFSGYEFQPDRQKTRNLEGNALQNKLAAMELEKRLDLLREQYAGSLLVIDNFDDPQKTIQELQSEKMYSTLLGLGIKLLFTTRSPIGYSIGALDEHQLMQLMRKYCKKVTDEQLRAFITITEGHTLTCELIAKTLSESWGELTAEDLMEALKKSTLNKEDYPEVQNDKDRLTDGVIKTMQIYEHLKVLFDTSVLDSSHQSVMRYAALLPEDGMDAVLFAACLTKEEKRALRNLEKRGWLKHSEESNLLTIHPIVREVVFEELMKGNEKKCNSFIEKLAYQHKNRTYNHITYSQMARYFAMVVDKLQKSNFDWDTIAFAGNWAGMLFHQIGNYQSALKYLNIVSDYEIIKYQDLHHAAMILNNLSVVYGALGKHEDALDWSKFAFDFYQQLFEKGRISELEYGGALSSLSLSYRSVGQYDKSEEYLVETIRIEEKYLDSNDLRLGLSYADLGSTYRLMGCWDKAEIYLSKAEKICEGQDSNPKLASVYNNLGCLYSDRKNYKEALVYYKKALAINQEFLPEGHPSLGSEYQNIGCTYVNLSLENIGLKYFEEAKKIWESSLPQDHPNLLKLYDNITICCRKISAKNTKNKEASFEDFYKYLKLAMKHGSFTYLEKAIQSHPISQTKYSQTALRIVRWFKSH